MSQTVHLLHTPRHLEWVYTLQGATRALLDWLRSRGAAWQESRRAIAESRALHALDDQTLKDIGLHRSEISSWVVSGETDRWPRCRY